MRANPSAAWCSIDGKRWSFFAQGNSNLKRDMDLVRRLLLDAEKSADRYFFVGVHEWRGYDPTESELQSELSEKELFHLDLLEQGGLIQKSVEPHSDGQYWEITWRGYEFLDAVRSDGVWRKLKEEAEARGISITVDLAVRAARELAESFIGSAL